MVQDENGNHLIKITWSPYNLEILEKIHSLPGRKWHGEETCWSAPIYEDSLKLLLSWGFQLDWRLQDFLENIKKDAEKTVSSGLAGLNGTLRPFQIKGVSFIESQKGRVLLGDEMGLGKSIQTIAWMHLHKDLKPFIVVCPATLKLDWKQKIEEWIPTAKTEVLSGSNYHKPSGDFIIINYDILQGWLNYLLALHPKVLVLDEIHYAKSNKAQRTKAVKKLCKKITHIIALSGTPLINRPIEGFNAFNLIDPVLFPDYWMFVQRYCNAKRTGFGWDFSGASNTQELHEKLINSFMIRRLKKDVLPELPDKIRSFVPIELDNAKEYEKAEKDFVSYVQSIKDDEAAERASKAQALASIEGLKQLAAKGKLNGMIDWIQDFLDVEEKLVVFVNHHFVSDALMKVFDKIAVKLDGTTSQANRQKAIDAFQTKPEIKLFIGNIQAAGLGITLTASSNVAFTELPWTPGAVVQAEDRCHRIGKKDSVNIYFLLAIRTIEEKIAKLIDNKRKVLDNVLDGIQTETESLLSELINQYKHK